MNAAQPQPTTPATPGSGNVLPPVGKDASQEIQKELEDNSLYNWLRGVPTRLKNSKSAAKILGGVLLVALAGGIWWWFSGEESKADAGRWKDMNNSTTPAKLEQIVKDYPNSTQSLVARRNQAELLFGPEGTEKLRNGDTRAAGIENIEKARADFVALAEEFKKIGDKSLRAVCLRRAAEAEESLIGIPKVGAPLEWDESQDRGTVAKAVEFYKEAAAAIGDKTTAGERFTALATQLEAQAKRAPGEGMPTPRLVGVHIHTTIKPKKVENEPKMPDKPIGAEVPPTGTEPKPPTKPLDPNAPVPMGTGTEPKPPTKPLTPTTAK